MRQRMMGRATREQAGIDEAGKLMQEFQAMVRDASRNQAQTPACMQHHMTAARRLASPEPSKKHVSSSVFPHEDGQALSKIAAPAEREVFARAVYGAASEQDASSRMWSENTGFGKNVLSAITGIASKVRAGGTLSDGEKSILANMLADPHMADLIKFTAASQKARERIVEYVSASNELHKAGGNDPAFQEYTRRSKELLMDGNMTEIHRLTDSFSPEVRKALARVRSLRDDSFQMSGEIDAGIEEQFAAIDRAFRAGSAPPSTDKLVMDAVRDSFEALPGSITVYAQSTTDPNNPPSHEQMLARLAVDGASRFELMSRALEDVGIKPLSLQEIEKALGVKELRAYTNLDSAGNVSVDAHGVFNYRRPGQYRLLHTSDEPGFGALPFTMQAPGFRAHFSPETAFGSAERGRANQFRQEQEEKRKAKEKSRRREDEAELAFRLRLVHNGLSPEQALLRARQQMLIRDAMEGVSGRAA